jgi:hypothetical protein
VKFIYYNLELFLLHPRATYVQREIYYSIQNITIVVLAVVNKRISSLLSLDSWNKIYLRLLGLGPVDNASTYITDDIKFKCKYLLFSRHCLFTKLIMLICHNLTKIGPGFVWEAFASFIYVQTYCSMYICTCRYLFKSHSFLL